MPRVRCVLFPTDFSTSAERALPVAIRFARLLGTGVHLVHVCPSTPNPEILEGIRSELDALASHIRASGIGCDADVLDGDVADVIIAKADEIDAELIVMAMHRRERFGKAAVAGVTQRVLMRTTLRCSRCRPFGPSDDGVVAPRP